MRCYLDRCYIVVRMKTGGAPIDDDRRVIVAVLSGIAGEARLDVDAQGHLDLETAIGHARMLRPYALVWYETPGNLIDRQLQATLGDVNAAPMATGKTVFPRRDAGNLIRHGGLRPDRDWLQSDCASPYGLVGIAECSTSQSNVTGHGGVASRMAAGR